MTCGAWPPCHKVRSLVHAGRDFTRDASGARAGRFAFKMGSISWVVVMPRSSCDHHALSPFGPPDGVHRCSLEGSASRPSLPATSPSEGVHSWWCHRSCLLSAAVGGVQPHGSWHPSTTIWLQGFSSCSLAAVPRRWSPRRMTTSLVVGRSKPGCDLSPTLSIKDVHHPRWGGRRVEPGSYPPYGSVTHFFLQHLEGKGVHQSCGRGGPWPHGAGRLQAVGCSVTGPLGLDGSDAASDAASRRLGALGVRTRRRTPRRWRRHSWTILSSLMLVETGAGTPSCVLRQPPPTGAEVVAVAGEATSCRGGCLRW
jgi:hypothetical protein